MPPERISLAACMVTFESAHVLRRAITALRAGAEGSAVDLRLVVVDNASEDGSADAAADAWPGANVLRLERNIGYGPAANRAADAAGDADWLLFVNPDAILAPGTLPLLPHVQGHDAVAAFSPLLTDERGRPVRTAYRWPTLAKEVARLAGAEAAAARLGRLPAAIPDGRRIELGEPVGEAIVVDYPVGACLFVRGAVWRTVGPFDTGFALYHEEMEWCWRAAAHGVRPVVLPRARAVHLGRASSRRRPAEALEWQYRGLLRFYEMHRSRAQRGALRAAMAASFGARAAAAGAVRSPRARSLWAVSRLGVRGR